MWRYRFKDCDGRLSFAAAPWADGLSAAHAELIALVPGTDINGALWSTRGKGPDGTCIAAVLCVDPFLRVLDRCAQLRAAGIHEIVNLPSVRLYEAETGRVLENTGYGWTREIEQLVRFKEAGFALNIVVRDSAAARDAIALGPKRLIVHPGLPPQDAAARQMAMKRAIKLCQLLRDGGYGVSLYRPRGFETIGEAKRGIAIGSVTLQSIRP